MQQTQEYNIEKLDDQSIHSILNPFKGRHVKIVVEEVKEKERPSQWELYQKALEVRERFKNTKVDPDLNLSDLAIEVNL